MTEIRMRKGKQRARLCQVRDERFRVRTNRSTFTYPLALVQDNGSWAYTGTWRGNAWRKAIRELKTLGWEEEKRDAVK